MTVGTFIHSDQTSRTTLSELKRIYGLVSPSEFFGVFAYATQSGVVAFDLEFGDAFWSDTPSRWLFGIDYGRTQPQALRRISEKQNSEVRIVDANWVLDQVGFIPRRDFHAKLSILANPIEFRYDMVVGSGNFSSNGLRKSIEASAHLYKQREYVFRMAYTNSR
jgi:HKD family nuclease